MNHHFLHENKDPGQASFFNLGSEPLSQHSFGFVHGFVFCLVLKNISKHFRNNKVSSGDTGICKSTDSVESSPLAAGVPSHHSSLSCAEVKEEVEVQTEEEHGDLDTVPPNLTVTSPKLQTHLTEADNQFSNEKDSSVPLFYMQLTGSELDNNDIAGEQWTDSYDHQADHASDVEDDQSSAVGDKYRLRKRRQNISVLEPKDIKKKNQTRVSKETQKSQSSVTRKSKHIVTQISDSNIIQSSQIVSPKRLKAHSEKLEANPTKCESGTVACPKSASHIRTKGNDLAVTETIEPSVAQIYTCDKCDKTFTTARSCERHTVKAHSRNGENKRSTKGLEKVFHAQCDKCPKLYTGGRAEKNLRQHILAYHSDMNPVQCDVCNVTLNNEHHLKLHKRSSHRKDVCYICGAHFVTQIGLQTHLLAHKGDKSYVCEVCGAAFVRVSSLRQHTKFHTDSRDFKCGRCPLSFKTFSSLSIHMMCVHQCGSYFSSQVQKLAKLGYVIDGESMERLQNCQCISCGQELVNSACPLHTSDCILSFSCPQCQWTTKDIQKFRKHLVRRNSATLCSGTAETKTGISGKNCGGLTDKTRPLVKNFVCPSCGKQFYTQSHLQAHRHQHAEKRFSCPVCDKSFTYKFNMQNHLTTHTDARPFECQTCQKTFKMKSQLQLHQRYHDGEFKCEICGKVLTRKQHVINHYKLVHPETQI